jgi:[2Fe-2S] binding domain
VIPETSETAVLSQTDKRSDELNVPVKLRINGELRACLSLAVAHQHDEITTIEGLAEGDGLHPMQSTFVECDAFQCGYMEAPSLAREWAWAGSLPGHGAHGKQRARYIPRGGGGRVD